MVNAKVSKYVRIRANSRCEYCMRYLPDGGDVEHIHPKALSLKPGISDIDDALNLALSCTRCNNNKGTKIQSIDYKTGKFFPLYNPREMNWNDHFNDTLLKPFIIGKTEIGRATASLLFRATDKHYTWDYPWSFFDHNEIQNAFLCNYIIDKYCKLKLLPNASRFDLPYQLNDEVQEARNSLDKEKRRRFDFIICLLDIKECYLISSESKLSKSLNLLKKLYYLATRNPEKQNYRLEIAEYHLMAQIIFQQTSTYLFSKKLNKSNYNHIMQKIFMYQNLAANHFIKYSELKIKNTYLLKYRAESIRNRFNINHDLKSNIDFRINLPTEIPDITIEYPGHVELTYAVDILLANKNNNLYRGKEDKLLEIINDVLSKYGYGQGYENDTILPLFRRYYELMCFYYPNDAEKMDNEIKAYYKLVHILNMKNEERNMDLLLLKKRGQRIY